MKNGLFLCLLLYLVSTQIYSQNLIHVVDDEGGAFKFTKPVSRIVSLSPHATELLFAAGASTQIVGAVSFSDYPESAKSIERVGSYDKVDIEAILSRNPDLVVAWSSGNSGDQIAKLKQLGLKVFISEPRQFDDIASNLRNMGKLLGTEKIANKAANSFIYELNQLKKTYPPEQPVNVFYQVWNDPLMTISNAHLIGHVIKFCSGRNVFGSLPVISPRVSIEAVIEKNPHVIIAGMTEERKEWLIEWDKWQIIQAVSNGHVYPVNADYVTRQTPRILKGIKEMCESLEKAREDLAGK